MTNLTELYLQVGPFGFNTLKDSSDRALLSMNEALRGNNNSSGGGAYNPRIITALRELSQQLTVPHIHQVYTAIGEKPVYVQPRKTTCQRLYQWPCIMDDGGGLENWPRKPCGSSNAILPSESDSMEKLRLGSAARDLNFLPNVDDAAAGVAILWHFCIVVIVRSLLLRGNVSVCVGWVWWCGVV